MLYNFKVVSDISSYVKCSIRSTERSPPVYQYQNDRLVSVVKRYQGDLDTAKKSVGLNSPVVKIPIQKYARTFIFYTY